MQFERCCRQAAQCELDLHDVMFRLRKTGYWLYIAGIVVLVAAPLLIFGTSNLLNLGIAMLSGGIGMLFILLYSLQLKHLQ